VFEAVFEAGWMASADSLATAKGGRRRIEVGATETTAINKERKKRRINDQQWHETALSEESKEGSISEGI
jgi:hypothetical protein